jgi:hypothetical protein
LPPGKYQIEFDVPAGWRWPSFSTKDGPIDIGPKRRGEIALESQKHASFDISFGIENRISGTVYGPDGNPMGGVLVRAYSVPPVDRLGIDSDYTDDDGNFKIKDLDSGNYVLAINDHGEISSTEPFPKFYYPNVKDREKASVFAIREGEHLDHINVHVSAVEETVTVSGILLYSDGKPVVDESIEFKPDKETPGFTGNAGDTTDATGHFRFQVLKGMKGQLFGNMFSYLGKYENCPQLDRLVNQIGGNISEIRTPAIPIDATADIEGVKLQFTFPKCNKAKDPN